jgi:cytochrome c-type biogenesis protein CcmH/NrfG
MTAEREAQFKHMVAEFPDSPMGHFSLGRYYLDERRWAESAEAFAEAVRLDPTYAAAWVGLGDAKVGLQDKEGARTAWQQALATPLGQKDLSLQGDLAHRLQELDDFG